MSEQSIEDQIKGLRQAALLVARQTGKENAQWIYRAADTIERLRCQLVKATRALEVVACDTWLDEIAGFYKPTPLALLARDALIDEQREGQK